MCFNSNSEVLQYVMTSYQLEVILETYFEQKKTPNLKAVRIIIQEFWTEIWHDNPKGTKQPFLYASGSTKIITQDGLGSFHFSYF